MFLLSLQGRVTFNAHAEFFLSLHMISSPFPEKNSLPFSPSNAILRGNNPNNQKMNSDTLYGIICRIFATCQRTE